MFTLITRGHVFRRLYRLSVRQEERGARRKEGQGGRKDEEEGWTRRNERRGGRSDEESEKMEIIKNIKNEKSCKKNEK